MLGHPLFYSITSLVLLVLNLEPFHIFPAAWIGWLPLFYTTYNPRFSLRAAFSASFLTGFLFYALAFYWLAGFNPLLFFIIVLLMTGIFSGFFAVVKILAFRLPSSLMVFMPAFLWCSLLFLFGLSPLGQTPLRFPFYAALPFHQLGALTSFDLLSVIIILLNSSLAMTAVRRRFAFLLTVLFVMVLFLGGLYAWGSYRMKAKGTGPLPDVALIQHNLPMDPFWREQNEDKIHQVYSEMAREAAAARPELIVFPQYSLPEDPLRHPQFMQQLAREIGIPILLASHIPVTTEENVFKDGYRNLALLVEPDGSIKTYEAVRGAPFQPVPEETAAKYEVLQSKMGKIGILLCYEDTRPEIAQAAQQLGADFLIALSNPGHFTGTLLPAYHLKEDQLRAIETGLPVFRVSANGYSAIIDPTGQVIQKSKLNEKQVLKISVVT